VSGIATLEIKEEPHSTEAEQMVLGGIFLDDKKVKDLADTIKVDMFYQVQHQEIFSAIIYLYNKNSHINYNTIYERLMYVAKKHKKPEPDIDYIISLSTSVPSMANYDNYVTILVDLYEKRELYKLSKGMLEEDISGIASNELIDRIKSKIDRMGNTSNLETIHFEDYIDDWEQQLLQDIENPQEVKKMLTGYKELDNMIKIKPTNLILVAARPGSGKSAFALNITKNLCKQGYYTLFVSLEMGEKELMPRLVANMAHVNIQKFENPKDITKEELERITQSKKDIKKFKLNSYTKSITIEQLSGLTKKLKKDGRLDALVVDYIQLVKTNDYRMSEYQRVSAISKKLKEIAMDLKIPVIALSQLSRSNIEQGGKPREPQLSDLRGSGSLEEDANKVLMLHRLSKEDVQFEETFVKLHVKKNREGKLGTINYSFYGDYMQFVEKYHNGERYVNVKQDKPFREYNENENGLRDNPIHNVEEEPKEEFPIEDLDTDLF